MDWLKRGISSIFPRPRKPVRAVSIVPLIVFLLLFAAVCVWLEWSGKLMFAERQRFALIAVSGWFWWMYVCGYAGLSRDRALVALMSRLILVGLFVMLLAEPRSIRTRDALTVVYAVDISDSVSGPDNEMTDKALGFAAQTIRQKREEDQAGLIVFGRTAQVELPPRQSYTFEAINSRVDRDATNIEKSLSLSAAMLPEESPGRIVLVTDGITTEGSLSRILDELKSRDIAVDVLPIQFDYKNEVWLEQLELPRTVKLGEKYEAGIVLSSLQAGSGKLLLRENGKVILEAPVSFQAGKNRFAVPIELRQAGYYEYAATIEVPAGPASEKLDNQPQNNTALNSIYVEGEGKVLLVHDPLGDERDWQPLAQAIRSSERVLEVRDAYSFPDDPRSLLPYDAIVFVNAPADTFTATQLEAVQKAVRDMGLGFLMVGGANSFGPGGFHRTPIEETLPVTLDVSKKRILPKGALAIILHTCEFAQGNTWAKRITKQAIKVLGAKDEVGVLAFTEKGDDWIFKLTPAEQYEKMVVQINAANIGDMPTFGTCMQMGLTDLLASDAAAKHMIIISDGDPSPPPPNLIQQFIDNQISISTVIIQPHGGADISNMQAVANLTKGRYYRPNSGEELPAIFIKESKTLNRTMIQRTTITPEMAGPDDAGIMKGIDAIPAIHGYVLTTPKLAPRGEMVLKAPVKEEDQLDPILAIGKYGVGKSAAFTSDLSANWGADWVGWGKFETFVKQLLIAVSRSEKLSNLRLWTYASGNEGIILLEDYHPQESFLQLSASVSGPREQVQEGIPLKQIGPRRYRATVPLWGRGRYEVFVQPVDAAERSEERATSGFIVPYSPEYLRFRSNPLVIDEISERTGGVKLSPDSASNENDRDPDNMWNQAAEEIYQTRRKPRQSSQPVFDWFLVAICLIIPFDVGIRRVQIDMYSIKSLLGLDKKPGPSTETMGALLERKKVVKAEMKADRRETPLPRSLQRQPVPPPTVKPKEAAAPQPPKQPAPAAPEEGTTSRLLDLKRRRQQEKDDKS